MPEINIILSTDKDADYSEFRHALLKSITDFTLLPYALTSQGLESSAKSAYLHRQAEITQYREECRKLWQ
ncbi:hypothetical protein KLER11_gp79 [Pararheinheimera phage vB_PsoM_KLER1-1]|nr:hypothetical protein KLER11_gp79 [Pararheinheimera phage vB_PsoM_KLER1-1]